MTKTQAVKSYLCKYSKYTQPCTHLFFPSIPIPSPFLFSWSWLTFQVFGSHHKSAVPCRADFLRLSTCWSSKLMSYLVSPTSLWIYCREWSQGCLDHKSLVLAPGSWQQSSHKFSNKRHIRIIRPTISQTQTHAKRAGLREGYYSSKPHHKFKLKDWKETKHGHFPNSAAGRLTEFLKSLLLNSTSGRE